MSSYYDPNRIGYSPNWSGYQPWRDPRDPRYTPDGTAGTGNQPPMVPGDRPAGQMPGMGGAGGGDPASDAAMAYLNKVLGGQEMPFDAKTQANMLTQASDMNAAAESAQNQDLVQGAVAGGASISDPSLRAASRNFMANRQAQNAQAANTIGRTANQANFNARMQAAGTVADYQLAREDRAFRQAEATRRGDYDSRRGGGYGEQGGQGGSSGAGYGGGSGRVRGYGGMGMQSFTGEDYRMTPEQAQYGYGYGGRRRPQPAQPGQPPRRVNDAGPNNG